MLMKNRSYLSLEAEGFKRRTSNATRFFNENENADKELLNPLKTNQLISDTK